jgi:hypothetical protein
MQDKAVENKKTGRLAISSRPGQRGCQKELFGLR